ncbi:peptide deformylase [bacterium]|nr:peptide deformylase [bacterium]
MTIQVVRTFSDPVLRKKADPIKQITPEIKTLARDMLETMYCSKGIGLAAPQVGVSQRIVTIDISNEGEELHPMVFINPEITKSSGQVDYEEGCLSVPGYHGVVIRPEQVTVRFQTLDGQNKTIPCKGLLARVLQHEIDHLDGVLFTDHLDVDWWESEEGQHMEKDHPRFSETTKFRTSAA